MHPEDALYVGDQVSFEVVFDRQLQEGESEVIVTLADGTHVGTAGITNFGIGRRAQSTLQWVWDTTGLEPSEHTLTFTIFPRGLAWTETYTLLPADPAVMGGTWQTTESDCCVYYLFLGPPRNETLKS
ncbi:MAG: hypothetical protein HC806_04165 [Anaerolineae bacterium]|nr:hypothetical protein [Anaerolineae bacterium]